MNNHFCHRLFVKCTYYVYLNILFFSKILEILPFDSKLQPQISTGGCKRINQMVASHSNMHLFEDVHPEKKIEL